MMKVTSKNGKSIDEETEEVKPTKKTRFLSLKDKNIVQIYYWYYDLQGKLKRDLRPPGYWHGRPRPFIREDIEEGVGEEEDLLTSYLRYYSDKDTLKAQMVTKYRKFEQTFLGEEDAGNAVVRKNVLFLLTEIPPEPDKHGHRKGAGRFGWELYTDDAMEFRRKKSVKPKPKRKPKKVVKKVIKKVVRKKRK